MNNLLHTNPADTHSDESHEHDSADSGQVFPPLLTAEIRRSLPPLYATENEPDPIVQVKFFTLDGQWTWHAIEFDGDDIFYGFVKGNFDELGYFSLREIQEVRGTLGLPVERDRYFEPARLSVIQ